MADRKLSASTAITGSNVAPASDYFMVLDVSDTTDAASGTNKKILAQELIEATGKTSLVDLSTKWVAASASAQSSLQFDEDTDNGTNKIVLQAPAAIASDKTLTLPDATDTLVGKATTDTLTNKTLTDAVNSISSPGTDTVGYLGLPQNSKSADYTCVMADSGKHILHPSSDANSRTFTIPANGSVAYPIGTTLTFINDSANSCTIAITTDTLVLAGTGSTGSRTLAQYGMATAVKISSTRWYINGNGIS